MKKVISVFTLLVLLSLLGSCKHGLKQADYFNYVRALKNGLIKKISVDNWEYSLQYKPYDYIILIESKGKFNKDNASKRKNELRGTAWFNISFRLKDGSVSPMRYDLNSIEDYNRRLNFFLNEAMHDIQAVYDGKDTLKQIGYLFENNYNLTPQETMIVGFELPKGEAYPEKDLQVAYNDEVFKNGIIKAIYKSEDLKKIPNLIY